jgi:hypothetical protein
LGGAFLIHDLGMGLAAYPDGFDGVRQRPEFRDLVTVLLTAKLERRLSVEELQHPDEAITNEAKFSFIRNLHAACRRTRVHKLDGQGVWQELLPFG